MITVAMLFLIAGGFISLAINSYEKKHDQWVTVFLVCAAIVFTAVAIVGVVFILYGG